jgi:hypothetical protein
MPVDDMVVEDLSPTDSHKLYLYSMCADGPLLPCQGLSPSDWEWPPSEHSKTGEPNFAQQAPEPAAEPPSGYTFPLAPTYVVNEDYDTCCSRGYYFSAPFDTTKAAEYKDHFNHLITPLNVSPYAFDSHTQTWLQKPIPGISPLRECWQYIHNVDGDPNKAITVAALFTSDSLIEAYEDSPEIKALDDRLCNIGFATHAGVMIWVVCLSMSLRG